MRDSHRCSRLALLVAAACLAACNVSQPADPQPPAAAATAGPATAAAPPQLETPATADAFVVHVPAGQRGPLKALRSCSDSTSDSAGCGGFTALSNDGSTLLLQRRRSRGPATPGAAWEEAYQIRRDLDVARVEPAFEYDLSAWGIEDGTRARGGNERPDKCAARRDPEWSLEQIQVPQAWAALRHDRSRPDGEEGSSVVIAHVDTGYRKHLEMWNADPRLSRLLVSDGYDFLDKDDDPLDPLDTSR